MTPETLAPTAAPGTSRAARLQRYKRVGIAAALLVVAVTTLQLELLPCARLSSSLMVGTMGIGGLAAASLLVQEPGVVRKLLALPALAVAVFGALLLPVAAMCG